MTYYALSSEDITYEMLDGEIVAIDFVRGTYHSLRGAAAPLFATLVAGQPAEHAAAWFTGAPASVMSEIADLITRWQEAGLLAVRADAPAPLTPPAPVAWAPPSFETFDDMQQLLLADPIHDVGDGAWPREAAPPQGVPE